MAFSFFALTEKGMVLALIFVAFGASPGGPNGTKNELKMTPKAVCPKIPLPSRRLRGSQRGLRTSVTPQSGLRGFWPELQMIKNATQIQDFDRFGPPEAQQIQQKQCFERFGHHLHKQK